jgi:hypothetical protein
VPALAWPSVPPSPCRSSLHASTQEPSRYPTSCQGRCQAACLKIFLTSLPIKVVEGYQACVNRSIAPWCKSVVVRRRPPRRNAAQDRSAGLALGRGRCARSQRRQRLCERAGSGAASGWGGSRIVDTNLCCSLDALTWGSRRSGGGAGSPWAGVACGAGEGFAGGAPRGWGAGSAGLGCLLAAPGGVLQLTPD